MYFLELVKIWFSGLSATLLFLLPGSAAAIYVCKNKKCPVFDGVLVGVLTTCVCGYVAFWIYLLHFQLGRLACCALYAGCAVFLYRNRSDFGRFAKQNAVRVPILFLLGTTLLYNAMGRSYHPNLAGPDAAVKIHGYALPNDNTLPLQLASHLFHGDEPRNQGGGWRSSDRPPLQSGVTVSALVATLVPGLLEAEIYQWTATLLQCLWIIAAFYLALACGITGTGLPKLLLWMVCSAFFFVNSFYAWPKLLAGALFALAVVCLYLRPQNRSYTAMGASFLSLSFLSHGGIAFSILPLGLGLVRLPVRSPIKRGVLILVVFLAWQAPWSLYKKYYDPPGNRLLKWHLAGAGAIDPRSTVQTLRDEYGKLTWEEWKKIRIHNFHQLFPASYFYWPKFNRTQCSQLRSTLTWNFSYHFGLLTLALPLLLAAAIAGTHPTFKRRKKGTDPISDSDSVREEKGTDPVSDSDSVREEKGTDPVFDSGSVRGKMGTDPVFDSGSVRGKMGTDPVFDSDSVRGKKGTDPVFVPGWGAGVRASVYWLTLHGALSVGFWWLAMFSADSLTLDLGSAGISIVLFCAFGTALSRLLPARLFSFLLVLQIANFSCLYLWYSVPAISPAGYPGLLGLGAVGTWAIRVAWRGSQLVAAEGGSAR